MRTYISAAKAGDDPDSECAAPIWQKEPIRVTFAPTEGQKLSFTIRGRSGEPEPADDQAEPEKQ